MVLSAVCLDRCWIKVGWKHMCCIDKQLGGAIVTGFPLGSSYFLGTHHESLHPKRPTSTPKLRSTSGDKFTQDDRWVQFITGGNWRLWHGCCTMWSRWCKSNHWCCGRTRRVSTRYSNGVSSEPKRLMDKSVNCIVGWLLENYIPLLNWRWDMLHSRKMLSMTWCQGGVVMSTSHGWRRAEKKCQVERRCMHWGKMIGASCMGIM